MKDTIRIAVLSDTHDLLRPQVMEQIKQCSAVIHAGDITKEEVLKEISNYCPVYAVRGNNDRGAWAARLKQTLQFEIAGVRFLLVHDRDDLPKEIRADFVIYGHSHQWECIRKDGRVWLNPGSCGHKRFRLPITMAVLEITDGQTEIYRMDLEQKEAGHSRK